MIRFERKDEDEALQQRQLHVLRNPTKTSVTKPIIQDHYGTTFNSVDRFNKLLGRVSFKPKCMDMDMRLLTGVISAAIVQAWVLVNNNFQGIEDTELSDLKDAAKDLADALVR